MNRQDRAKQFLPFDTLKGLRAELKRRDEIHSRMDKPGLSDTQQAEISEHLKTFRYGDVVCLTYYAAGHVRAVEDVFKKIDLVYDKIYLENAVLPLSALLSAEKSENDI